MAVGVEERVEAKNRAVNKLRPYMTYWAGLPPFNRVKLDGLNESSWKTRSRLRGSAEELRVDCFR